MGGLFCFLTLRFLRLTRELREGAHLGYLYQLVVCHPTGAGGWRDSKRLFPGDYAAALLQASDNTASGF